jgi:HD superfamily phosphohydrolase
VRYLPGQAIPSRELIKEVEAGVLRKQHDEIERLRGELTRLQPLHENQIKGFAQLLVRGWLTSSDGRQRKAFFDDPVWGQNCVDEELAGLFFQPLVQRLNYIKQLSFAYLTFPNATHSRLAHSLGTCRNLEASLTAIFRNNLLYTATARETISLDSAARRDLIIKGKTIALLHDVGHAPFGHALDKFVGFLDPAHPLTNPDKHYSKRYLEKHLVANLPKRIDAKNLATILGPDRTSLTAWDTLIADLLDSSLDVDRMDFLVRDAHMTGLSMGVTGVEAIIERMCPFREGDQIFLTFEESCVPYVDDFLLAREKMYAVCYEHPSKLAAERIFTRLVENLVREHHLAIDTVMLLTDEQILALLGLAAISSEENGKLLDALLQNIEFKCVLEVGLKTGNAQIEQWTKKRDSTRMVHWAYVDAPSEWERTITTAAGLENRSWQVLVTVPDQKTGVPNEMETQILKRDGAGYRIQPLFEASPSLRIRLKEENIPRSKIRVFVDSRLSGEQILEVEKAAKDHLCN